MFQVYGMIVHKVWKLKSLKVQLCTSRKRHKVSEGLDVVVHGDEVADMAVAPTGFDDIDSYLQQLELLIVAIAKAGCYATASPPTEEETPASDPCKYVFAPLEIGDDYLQRCVNFCRASLTSGFSQAETLACLAERDEQERTEWCERFRLGGATFGRIHREVYDERKSMWLVDKKTQPEKLGQGMLSPSTTMAGITVKSLKSGAPLCPEWNLGRCHKERCSQGFTHACNIMVKKNGRACGLRNHRAINCSNRNKTLS